MAGGGGGPPLTKPGLDMAGCAGFDEEEEMYAALAASLNGCSAVMGLAVILLDCRSTPLMLE